MKSRAIRCNNSLEESTAALNMKEEKVGCRVPFGIREN